jgi:hypothetical protein
MPKMFPYPGHMKKTNHSVYEVCFTGILDHQLYTNLIQSFRHLSFDLIDIFSIYDIFGIHVEKEYLHNNTE